MLISVILSTRNRADDLRRTLQSLGTVAVPNGCTCELLAIDNASDDHTAAVITETGLPNMKVRGVLEENIGQSHARNRGIAKARGEILVFTDDDIRYQNDWLEAMTGPLRRGELDALTGTMQIAPHLERDWMRPMHYIWLAAPQPGPASSGAPELIGANMAVTRQALSRVPWFDPELGPGAYGFGDDTLFGYQLERAGYRLGSVPLSTEHHFLPERLTRVSFLRHARKLGQSAAYLGYHWEHKTSRAARMNFYRKHYQLLAWRMAHPAEIRKAEGMHPSEMHHLRSLHLYGQAQIERRRPRNYEHYGLMKKPDDRGGGSEKDTHA